MDSSKTVAFTARNNTTYLTKKPEWQRGSITFMSRKGDVTHVYSIYCNLSLCSLSNVYEKLNLPQMYERQTARLDCVYCAVCAGYWRWYKYAELTLK